VKHASSKGREGKERLLQAIYMAVTDMTKLKFTFKINFDQTSVKNQLRINKIKREADEK